MAKENGRKLLRTQRTKIDVISMMAITRWIESMVMELSSGSLETLIKETITMMSDKAMEQ